MRSQHKTGWDEDDALSTWGRRYICWVQKAGVSKAIKKRSHKIDRQINKRVANDGTQREDQDTDD